MKNKHSGSCLCGKVKYEVRGEFNGFYLCHCGYCRKDTGSAHAANLCSTTASLTWIGGESQVKTFSLPSTRHSKGFCAECGAAVPSWHMGGKLLVVPAGGLDTEVTRKPDAHIFYASKAGWDDGLENVKKFAELPS